MIIAHRGNDLYGYKENTKEAILSSLKSNYTDGVEFDIRMTKDQHFVLNHGLIYQNQIIKYSNYKNLGLVDLKKVLKSIKSEKILIIEIKDNDVKVIEPLHKILKKFKKLHIWIHTFHYEVALSLKQKYPTYPVGLIVGNLININKDIKSFDFISLFYQSTKNYSKKTILWTVNDEDKIKNYYLHKIDIITDKPYVIMFTS